MDNLIWKFNVHELELTCWAKINLWIVKMFYGINILQNK